MEWEDLRSSKGCLRYGVKGAGSNMRHLGDGAGGVPGPTQRFLGI